MKNKVTGITYVYESVSYWDKEKKQPRNKKKLIGKIDPVTGEVVPTHKKGEPTDANQLNDSERVKYEAEILALKTQINEMSKEISSLKASNKVIIDELKKLIKEYE